MKRMYNENSLDTLCGALCYAMGIEAPEYAAAPNEDLCAYIDSAFAGRKTDRVFMYNPDAIAQWICEKYPYFLAEAVGQTDMRLPLRAVMPSVTPVCFGTMYTGAQPEVHGIRSYVKPVIAIDTIFDALIRSGKKPAIVSTEKDSMAKIYLDREMDYYLFDTMEKVNAKAAELIASDKYDFIAVYNHSYDTVMHKYGPESPEALAELKANARTFGIFSQLIQSHWTGHDTLVGFAMDHGCHEIDGNCGSHGLDMEEDLNILHLYKGYPKTSE